LKIIIFYIIKEVFKIKPGKNDWIKLSLVFLNLSSLRVFYKINFKKLQMATKETMSRVWENLHKMEKVREG